MTAGSDPRFVDTNILIYAHDVDAGEKHGQARTLTREPWGSDSGWLSIQVLQEFFVTVTRRLPSPLASDEATEAVEDFSQWTLHALDADDLLDAIAVHRRFDISFWDAMVINRAAKLGCQIMYSEDLNAGQE